MAHLGVNKEGPMIPGASLYDPMSLWTLVLLVGVAACWILPPPDDMMPS